MATFTPPYRSSVPAVAADTPSWQRKPAEWIAAASLIPRGVNVFKLVDGTYTENQPTDYTQIAVWYMGGHSYDVTAAEVTALVAAGYGANVT